VVESAAAFLAVSAVVIVTPGQDTALTIRNAVAGGRRGGVFTALGVAAGQATWTLAASAGVAAVLTASEPVFDALRLAGAAYLIFLGLQALRDAVTARSSHVERATERRRLHPRAAFRQGVVSNLANPKMAVFFTSLLPQFATSFAGLLAFGLVFCALTFAWLSAYAVVIAKAGDIMRRRTIRRMVDAVTGVVLVAFGARLASEPR
jgi:threonine/homoserine/homoserine lactone efflux protein